VLAAVVQTAVLSAQAIAGELPEKPRSLVEINLREGQTVRSVVEQLVRVAKAEGYSVSGEVQWSEGFFRCFRPESPVVHHWVAIWVEWSVAEPGKVVRVYLDYVKLRKFSGSDWQRQTVTEKDIVHNTNQLRQRIIDLALLGGLQ
jgi:hypothetical protein